MKINRGIILIVLVSLAVTLLAHVRQLPTLQEGQEAMKRHRERTRGTVSTREALLETLRSQGSPGGIVMLSQCDEPARHSRPVGSSLHELLDSLVSIAPQYKWHAENGVFDVVPKSGVPAFLEVRIARFKAEKVRSPDEALAKLFETPEVREAMANPAIGSRLFRGGIGYYDPHPDAAAQDNSFSINSDNVTVRDVLNAIAREHGRAMWTYRQLYCRGVNDFEINFSVW